MNINISCHKPVFSESIVGLNGFEFNKLVCFIAEGDLPQGIAEGCFLFTEIGTSFKKGDLIITRTKSETYKYKIKYANEIESDYFGRVLMATKLFAKEELRNGYQ
ncbi:hypothetical protein [Senegalia sp. (in: firmicutes)]|uniref:hypothetical protein n=1 Tax=Senegalia sp. (in: firmicutes) TaxID=1924098 RepID=UPI003F975F4F